MPAHVLSDDAKGALIVLEAAKELSPKLQELIDLITEIGNPKLFEATVIQLAQSYVVLSPQEFIEAVDEIHEIAFS